MREQWRPVVGAEGRYEVSDLGRVRSVDHVVLRADPRYTPARQVRRPVRGRVLRPATKKSGHLDVAIGKGNQRQVHQLVMEAFVGPPPAGHEVLHRNHNPADNRLVNLRYGTRSENLKMDYAAGVRRVHPNFIGARWRV